MNLNQYLYNISNEQLYNKNNNHTRVKIYPHQSKGRIIYSPSANGICDKSWVIIECEKEIVNYYKWFLEKKGVQLDSLLWGSHISIIRGSTLDCIDEYHMNDWKYNNNELIEFQYGDLVTNGVHWWLEVQSKQLEDIREHFGLKPHPDFGFHLTIGKIRPLKKTV